MPWGTAAAHTVIDLAAIGLNRMRRKCYSSQDD
jgi:hypothetical protein